MGQYRAVILKGFAPNYDSNSASKIRVLWHLFVDSNNYSQLNYDYSSKKFNYIKNIGGSLTTLSSNVQTFSQWQTMNFICEQTNQGMTLRIYKNGSSYEKYTNNDMNTFTGNAQFYLLTKDSAGNEADGFYEYLGNPIDLTSFPSGIPESIALDILNGNQNGNAPGWEAPQLLDTTQSNTQTIQVLPNNQYQLTTNISTTITEYWNTTITKSSTVTSNTVFTTQSRTNNIKFDINGGFSGLSFRRKD